MFNLLSNDNSWWRRRFWRIKEIKMNYFVFKKRIINSLYQKKKQEKMKELEVNINWLKKGSFLNYLINIDIAI